MPTFDTRGFDIYYEEHPSRSDADGVPLVLIMGAGGSCQGWTVLQVPELSKDRANVIFDNRGAGRSGDPGVDFTTRDMAEDTLALLDHLELERAHILGAFLGGLAAQHLAIDHPERVQSLILAGTFACADAKRRLLFEVMQGMSELPLEVRVKNRLIWTLHDLTLEHTDLVDGITRYYHREEPGMEERAARRQLQAALEHDTLAAVERIQAPTLVVCGEQDQLTPPHLHRELANRVPNARFVPIPGAGHLVAVEMAMRFNRLVTRFLLEYDKGE